MAIGFSAPRRDDLVRRAIAIAGVANDLAMTLAKAVTRSVTAHGRAIQGYRGIARPAEQVDCVYGEPTLGAVHWKRLRR